MRIQGAELFCCFYFQNTLLLRMKKRVLRCSFFPVHLGYGDDLPVLIEMHKQFHARSSDLRQAISLDCYGNGYRIWVLNQNLVDVLIESGRAHGLKQQHLMAPLKDAAERDDRN